MKITNSVTEYIQKNLMRKNAHWALKDGKWFFEIFPGVWAHQESFDEFFPKYEYRRNARSGETPDKTYIL